MDGTRALVFAFLLCVAPIGGVVVGAEGVGGPGELQETTADPDRSMTVLATPNTSEYLAPSAEGIERSGNHTAGLDVAAAVEADAGGLESAYLGETLERRYTSAASDAEHEAVVEDGVERLAARAGELRGTERTAIRQYNEGAIDARELLRTLTVVARVAGATVDRLEWLETRANRLEMDAEADRAATERAGLVPATGPVRTELAGAAAGSGSVRVYVETAGDGVVLAAIDRDDGTYLREAHDPSARDRRTQDQYGGSPLLALERMERIYPWVTENNLGVSASPIGPPFERVYRFSIPHPHGELETYLDSGSEAVAIEFQRNDLDSLPTQRSRTTANGLRLVVDTTRGGGPIGVSALDDATGDPLNARIELGGDPIGSTDGDRLWAVAPRGPVTVTAAHDGETVSLEASPS
ncbi:uncharacterized protein Nmlp_1190 [Natronomonas moolapensis 8.8.11]|uniref:Uncharacterized protein n=1 Tax=Natronomonas moolapensis (strain DSM 18674 / CECT 7526 / JCM 14361 / 8.8.11) TaxID=268739 RepID=M1XNC8_NATM8|nr:hypothetical protein [Natronomonas moolapensis]CCQ35400.1 uncharacterized protein Nmlp_1190 [Natronomonas moolapensis 8.8.11]